MKKTMKNQLFAAVSILIVAVVLLTSATYAWFTSVANPEVGKLYLYAKASDAMLLSELADPAIDDTTKWNSTITQAMISAVQTSAFPEELFNVSSPLSTVSSDFYAAVFDATGSNITGYSKIDAADISKNVVKFDLWVKSTQNGLVYLDGDATLGSYLKGVLNETGAAQTDTDNLAHIADTIRVAFVPLNYDADGVGGSAASTGADWANRVIWEPNSATHHADAAVTGKQDFKPVISTSAVSSTAVATFDFNQGTTTTTIPLFNLTKDTRQQFSVYIWVEGTDADTINKVANAWFETYLRFGQTVDGKIGTYNFE